MARKVAYVCTNCTLVFDTPTRKAQHHIENYYEHISVCPRCGSDEIEMAMTCDVCHESFEHDDLQLLKDEGIRVCKDCRKKVKGLGQ